MNTHLICLDLLFPVHPPPPPPLFLACSPPFLVRLLFIVQPPFPVRPRSLFGSYLLFSPRSLFGDLGEQKGKCILEILEVPPLFSSYILQPKELQRHCDLSSRLTRLTLKITTCINVIISTSAQTIDFKVPVIIRLWLFQY